VKKSNQSSPRTGQPLRWEVKESPHRNANSEGSAPAREKENQCLRFWKNSSGLRGPLGRVGNGESDWGIKDKEEGKLL